MESLNLQPTPLAEWFTLIKDAERICGKRLADELENYLVLLLQRFSDKPEMVRAIMALDYLNSCNKKGGLRDEQLRDVGDKCLLFSGLFPEHAIHRSVSISYFIQLGQQAYHLLASHIAKQSSYAELFDSLNLNFVGLMDTLQCIRELAGNNNTIMPLQAEELWRNFHSEHALRVLRQYTQATLIKPHDKSH